MCIYVYIPCTGPPTLYLLAVANVRLSCESLTVVTVKPKPAGYDTVFSGRYVRMLQRNLQNPQTQPVLHPRHRACVRPACKEVTHLDVPRISQEYRQHWPDPNPHNRAVCPSEPKNIVKEL
jgi:hypothetical protein